MKNLAIIVFLPLFFQGVNAQNLYFPPIQGNAWDTLHPDSLQWCPERIDTLYNYLENTGTRAFMILKDGKIVLEKYFDTHTASTAWYWASAGKSLTAFVVGIAQQEGHLSIQDSVSKYLGTGWTSATPQQEGAIKVVHQLSMTTGLDDGVANVDCTLDTCLNYLAAPGTRWAYHNAPYTLLDQVIESATATSLNNYLNQKVKSVTGMSGAFLPVDFNNVYFSTARSMARFGLLMLNQGVWNGIPVLTDTNYYQAMIQSSQSMNPAYGYLWWLNGKSSFQIPSPNTQFSFPGSFTKNAPNDMYSAIGRDAQILSIIPSQNLIVLRMGNDPNLLLGSIAYQDSIWDKINKLNCNAISLAEWEKMDFQLSPNPAHDYLQISTTQKGVFEYQIIDFQGRILSKRKIWDYNAIPISHLPKGFYMLQFFDTQGGVKTMKWLKI
jgi:CubicO group peptidase (beta-lactamase class C family)